jgi:hypothetical protein
MIGHSRGVPRPGREAGDQARGEGKSKDGRFFFFEKKKQKTFVF